MPSIPLPLIFSLITTVISAFFAYKVLTRWRSALKEGKQRPHLRAWGIGLVLYAIGAFSQVVLTFTWSPLFFTLWYWTGAMMVAPWLGQGTVYLLVRRGNIARNIEAALLLVSVITLPWLLLLTKMDSSGWYAGADMNVILYRVFSHDSSRSAFVGMLNTWGTVALAGGAIYSSILFRRKQILRERMVGNWLIALGGLLPALGGAFVSYGLPTLNYIGIMLGVILIYLGYQQTANAPDDAKTSRRAAAGTAGV